MYMDVLSWSCNYLSRKGYMAQVVCAELESGSGSVLLLFLFLFLSFFLSFYTFAAAKANDCEKLCIIYERVGYIEYIKEKEKEKRLLIRRTRLSFSLLTLYPYIQAYRVPVYITAIYTHLALLWIG